ncbi:hypothetical protein [Porphyromonas somerae]|uniref:hypothetical protein n=1 Tax=Porphyromonas somerae TaxID=322095 RepID=UPI002A74CB41|nr:hypothetical protein [Porphyromonas somerae]MDY3120800.1 hypothetical protein [Porphyromonas somerae]
MKQEKLSLTEMSNLFGGISVEEYCDQVSELIDANWGRWTEEERKSAAVPTPSIANVSLIVR